MVEVKVYRVDITISEYNLNDEGFYNIKENMEIVKGPKQLLITLENVYFNTVKYIERGI